MANRLFPVLALALSASAAWGCSPDRSGCPASCPDGEECDRGAGRCIPEREPRWSEPAPAARLDVESIDGRPLLSAVAPSRGAVVAGEWTSSGTRLRQLAEVDRSTSTSLAVGDRPFVAWVGDDGRIRLVDRDAERWTPPRPVNPEEGRYTASPDFDLAVSEAPTVHLVFRDARSGALRHLERPPSGPWQLETIDDGERDRPARSCDRPDSVPAGRHPDLSLLDGRLFAAYFDPACGNLRLARRTADGWAVSLLDTGARDTDPAGEAEHTVGRFPALATDSEGELGAAYYDAGRGRLYYAAEDQGQFRIELVDPGVEVDRHSQKRNQLVGPYASLAFDGRDAPRIAYHNASELRLQIAVRPPSNGDPRWLHRELDSRPPSGFYAQLVLPEGRGPLVFAERKLRTDADLRSRLVAEDVSP